ncbi:MAG: TetR/AcrR family transcriptional regulator [Caldimonas sp.]
MKTKTARRNAVPVVADDAAPPLGQAVAKTRGRPLSFDRAAALDKAMHVFWERGYEAASIADLTTAMGITPPSLYTAFGDKEHLFLEAIEAYGRGPGGFGARALAEEATARGAVQRLLDEAAAQLTEDCHPLGCMMVTAATNCSVAAEHVQAVLARLRAVGVQGMRDRIQRGIDEGELPAGTDAGALASFYATVYQGMSMQAKDGVTRASLQTSVDMAMRSWPAAPVTRRPVRQASVRLRKGKAAQATPKERVRD